MIRLIDTVDVNNTLGEGVVWHEKSKSVWWTDIEQNKLYAYQVNQKKLAVYNTPYRLCAFGFTLNSTIIIAAFDCGIALYNYETQTIDWLFKLPSNSPIRFNDGRIDAKGRFWVGTMNESQPQEKNAGLYRVDTDLRVEKVADNIGIANGIAWNNEASLFYLADSALQTIFQYDFDADIGAINNPRIYAQTIADVFPDGAIVDSKDNLWSAHWGGACLVCYSINGETKTYEMPVSQPTCVVFGGDNSNLLFVTTASYGLSAIQKANQPLAGSLLIFESDVTGSDSHIFSTAELTHA
ncbi:MAG: SMP-30/gluconolactonase/LRE family protein [Colwellia sp.]|nr:SMP-30/gluconolactonase/LRE family protein [Colwellia sp.]